MNPFANTFLDVKTLSWASFSQKTKAKVKFVSSFRRRSIFAFARESRMEMKSNQSLDAHICLCWTLSIRFVSSVYVTSQKASLLLSFLLLSANFVTFLLLSRGVICARFGLWFIEQQFVKTIAFMAVALSLRLSVQCLLIAAINDSPPGFRISDDPRDCKSTFTSNANAFAHYVSAIFSIIGSDD